jgi:hypothetical protein
VGGNSSAAELFMSKHQRVAGIIDAKAHVYRTILKGRR